MPEKLVDLKRMDGSPPAKRVDGLSLDWRKVITQGWLRLKTCGV